MMEEASLLEEFDKHIVVESDSFDYLKLGIDRKITQTHPTPKF